MTGEVKISSGGSQVEVKSQEFSELDIGGRETCPELTWLRLDD